MTTTIRNNSNIKKGDKLFAVGAWNFIYGTERRDHFRRDEKGKGYFVPFTSEVWNIQEFEVFSCGKREMYLKNEAGMRGKAHYANRETGEFGWFVTTYMEAVVLISELRAADEFTATTFEIENHKY